MSFIVESGQNKPLCLLKPL